MNGTLKNRHSFMYFNFFWLKTYLKMTFLEWKQQNSNFNEDAFII